jgi:hypothetical protein
MAYGGVSKSAGRDSAGALAEYGVQVDGMGGCT